MKRLHYAIFLVISFNSLLGLWFEGTHQHTLCFQHGMMEELVNNEPAHQSTSSKTAYQIGKDFDSQHQECLLSSTTSKTKSKAFQVSNYLPVSGFVQQTQYLSFHESHPLKTAPKTSPPLV